jgi:hypothetical protein
MSKDVWLINKFKLYWLVYAFVRLFYLIYFKKDIDRLKSAHFTRRHHQHNYNKKKSKTQVYCTGKQMGVKKKRYFSSFKRNISKQTNKNFLIFFLLTSRITKYVLG